VHSTKDSRAVSSEFKISKILITHICRNNVTQEEIEQLARDCIRLATSYLSVLERYGHGIRESHHLHELNSIAADCVADLFVRNHDGLYVYLARFFNFILKSSITEEDLFIALRRLVTRKVWQSLSHIYRERNPEGARLIRNIRLATKRHASLELDHDIRGEIVRYKGLHGKTECFCETVRPSIVELEATAASVLKNSMTIDVMVLELMQALAHGQCQAVEIPVSELGMLIRKWRNCEINQEPAIHENPLTAIDRFELEKRIKIHLLRLKEKLRIAYVSKNKLTCTQATAIYAALDNMVLDALHGNQLSDHYTYLSHFWPELTLQEYMTQTRKTFEYFVRQLKASIKTELGDF
jgi:hypothetical protein